MDLDKAVEIMKMLDRIKQSRGILSEDALADALDEVASAIARAYDYPDALQDAYGMG